MTTKTVGRPKSNRIKVKKGVVKTQRSQKQRIVETDIIEMVRMYHQGGISYAGIGFKYGITRQRVGKIIKDAEGRIKLSGNGTLTVYDSSEVKSRIDLNPFERAKKLSDDATQACEISINLINHELKAMQEKVAVTGKSLSEQGIDTEKLIEKLTKFFQATAPYVIDRKDGKQKEDGTADGQMHKLMNKSMPLRKVN